MLQRHIIVFTPFGQQRFTPVRPPIGVVRICYNGQHFDAVVDKGKKPIPVYAEGEEMERIRAQAKAQDFIVEAAPISGCMFEYLDAVLGREAGTTAKDLAILLDYHDEGEGPTLQHGFMNSTNALQQSKLRVADGSLDDQRIQLVSTAVKLRIVVFTPAARLEFGCRSWGQIAVAVSSQGCHKAWKPTSALTQPGTRRRLTRKTRVGDPESVLGQVIPKGQWDHDPDTLPSNSSLGDEVRILCANVRALQSCTPDILKSPADIYALSETNVNADESAELAAQYKTRGYRLLMRNSRGAGVAVLVKSTLRAWEMHVPELEPWSQEGRILVTRITTITGSIVCVLITVYGDPNGLKTGDGNLDRRERFRLFYDRLVQYMATAGKVPVLLVGDFNAQFNEVEALGDLVDSGGAHDLIRVHDCLGERSPTCRGTRVIDHVLANAHALHVVKRASQSPHFWPADHKCMTVTLRLMEPNTRVTVLKIPKPLPPQCGFPQETDKEGKGKGDWATREPPWCPEGNPDQQYQAWSARWEKALIARAEAVGIEVPEEATGRDRAGIRTQKVSFEGSKEDGRNYGPEMTRLEFARSEVAAIKRKIGDSGLDDKARTRLFAALQPVREPISTLACLEREPQETLQEVHQCLSERIQRDRHECQRERMAKWNKALESYNDPHSKKAYQYIRAQWCAPLTAIQDEGGEVVTDVKSMDAIIRKTRERVKQMAKNIPQRDQLEWMPLEAEDLRRAARVMKKGKAPGLRRWHPEDLHGLPLEAWRELAALTNTWERGGQLPEEWRMAVQTMVPKDTSGNATSPSLDPLKLRPISVLPAIARTWARARLMSITPKLEESMLDSVYGARRGKSAKGLIAKLLGRLERAATSGQRPIYLAQLDVSKFFNGIDTLALHPALQRMGLSAYADLI
eukprot:1344557-Amphidinium_carterae.1